MTLVCMLLGGYIMLFYTALALPGCLNGPLNWLHTCYYTTSNPRYNIMFSVGVWAGVAESK